MFGQDEPPDPIIGQTIGGFSIEKRLGVGGMGTVYLAKQDLTKRPAAVKLIHPRLINPTLLKRFQQEAMAISRLTHPNIVTMYSYGQHDSGELYIAMEYVSGKNLADVLRQDRAFDPRRALPLMIQMAEAVALAHDQNIVHRDLKPENVMITRFGRKEAVKVLDFGLAKVRDNELVRTKTGALLGSPPFMSPEQWAQDRTIDGRTDIYALGCIFYVMLLGRLPFKGNTTMEYMKSHMNDTPVRPEKIWPPIERYPGLAATIMRCISRDRETRFQDCYRVSEALSAVAELHKSEEMRLRATTAVANSAAAAVVVESASSIAAQAVAADAKLPASKQATSPATSQHKQLVSAEQQSARPRSSRLPVVVAIVVAVLIAGGIAGLRQWRAQAPSERPAFNHESRGKTPKPVAPKKTPPPTVNNERLAVKRAPFKKPTALKAPEKKAPIRKAPTPIVSKKSPPAPLIAVKTVKSLSLIIVSVPKGGTVLLGGVELGPAPQLVTVKSGQPKVNVLLKLKGYHNLETTIDYQQVTLLKDNRLRLKLKPKSKKKLPRTW